MKRIINIILTLLISTYLFSQDQLQITGQLLSNQRILTKDRQWVWNENRLTLNLEKKLTGNSKFYSELWIRNIGLPQYYSLSDLYNKNITDPWSLEIRQAYATVYGLLNGHLDLTAGKQIINWGTADKFNPTNNLNPYDYEDVLDFGRKRGVIALKADVYFNDDNYLELVFEPFFTPANLPIGPFADILTQADSINLPDDVVLGSMSDSLFLPQYKLEKSYSWGARFKGFVAGIDYSFSYVFGYDQFPYPTHTDINLSFVSFRPPVLRADMLTKLSFYRQHILGFDLSTNLAGIGLWAEAAAFIPAQNIHWTFTTYYPEIIQLQPQTKDSLIRTTNDIYVKYTLGMDYTFSNGIYLNAQFIHGFLHERKPGKLNDYIFIRAEKNILNDKFTIAPLTAGIMIGDWKEPKQDYALIYIPQFTYKPTDNFEISFMAALFDGKGDNIFARLKDMGSMAIFAVKYSF